MPGVQDRVAVVTGAARGIGAATAALLAAEGASVAVLDHNQAGAEETAAKITSDGHRAMPIVADVSQADQVTEAFERVSESYGGVHILVNNAGVLRDNLLFKMSEDDWDTVMNVHLKGAFLCSRAAQKYMVEARFGRIINISSTAALGNRGQVNYSSAKAGLQGLARTMAIELGPFGVTCNAVAPGFVETEMTKATAERLGSTIDEMREASETTLPVRRGGLPADIANAVWFLARDESGYITGQVLYVDGGRKLR
jgi:3-oxoacyl-[acyl-carrier protein] reductase